MKLVDSLVPEDFRATIRGPLRRFYLCTFVACVGAGLTLSLFVIYVHNVRGFSTPFATGLLAVAAIAGLASAPLWGTLTDRLGPLFVMVMSSLASTAALALFAFAHTKWPLVTSAIFLTVTGGAGWGPGSTMLSRLVPPEMRQRAFGVNFMLVNLGIGFGGLISASVVSLSHPGSFTALYCFDALVTLTTTLFYLSLRGYGHAEHGQSREEARLKEPGSWSEVVRDRRLVRYVLAVVVLMIGGYGSLDTGFSLFVVNNLHITVHAIGVMFFFNTSAIVLAQLWVLNRIEHRSRTRVMALVAVFWCSFWFILAVSLDLPKAVAFAALCFAMVVFAIGETMLQPVGSAIVNHIAPAHLRGRYNAASGLAWGFSSSIAPAITALYFSLHLGDWWPMATGLTALLGGVMILRLGRLLSAEADGRVAPTGP